MTRQTTTRLDELLTSIQRAEKVDPTKEYRLLGIRLDGRGPFLRETLMGTQTSATKLFRVAQGDFIYSRLFACRGAFGVIGEELDGCYVSGEFPTFVPVPGRVDVEFLKYWFQLPNVIARVDADCTGSTPLTRNRFKTNYFLALEVPLPSLAEQQRVVSRIEELASQIREARTLRGQAEEEAQALYAQSRDEIFRELRCERRPIGELFDLVNGRAFKPTDWQEDGYRIIRIQNLKYVDAPYNHYAGEVESKHLVRDGDVLFAWSGQVVSLGAHIWRGEEAILNQHIFNVRSRANFLPEFIKEGFNALIDEMKEQVRGLEMFHIRKQELTMIPFPVPTLEEQRQIVARLDALQAEVGMLRTLQTETAAELKALVPAVLDRAFKGEL